MTNTILYVLWGGLYILCAGLGFIPQPEGLGRVLLIALSLLFFLPPGLLLYRAKNANTKKTVKIIRNLSLLSLGLTLITLVLNFLSVTASAFTGTLLYGILVILSAPMVCGQYWAMSLFLWACLLMTSISFLKKS